MQSYSFGGPDLIPPVSRSEDPVGEGTEVAMTEGAIILDGHIVDASFRDYNTFDYDRLAEELLEVKKSHEARHDVILMGDPAVPYGAILKAAATCREKVVEGAGQKIAYPLFPVIHFADLPP